MCKNVLYISTYILQSLDAVRYGLINKVVPEEDLETEVFSAKLIMKTVAFHIQGLTNVSSRTGQRNSDGNIQYEQIFKVFLTFIFRQ